MSENARMQALRHATMFLTINGKTILTDPMLSEKEAMEPSEYTSNKVRIPLVELPVDLDTIRKADAILLTHLHFDHFDEKAEEVLPRDLPTFCQPSDVEKLNSLGFNDIRPVDESVEWEGITLMRAAVNHGSGEVLDLMGDSSAFLLEHDGHRTMIGGDGIYDSTFESVLDRFAPDTAILFAGEAQLIMGDPITMGSEDIIKAASHLPEARVIVVHMEALNHCSLTREQLRGAIAANDLADRIAVPEDGEVVQL